VLVWIENNILAKRKEDSKKQPPTPDSLKSNTSERDDDDGTVHTLDSLDILDFEENEAAVDILPSAAPF